MRAFFALWASQSASLLGSGMIGFAVGVWAFERTGSATRFALITFFGALPALLVSPLAGALVDRWDRRAAMIVGDGVSALTSLALLALAWDGDHLRVGHIYLAVAVNSAFGALQQPAFTASVPLLVPRDQLGRAAGLSQMSAAAAQILAPLAAGALLVVAGLRGVLALDLAAAVVAVGILLRLRLPRPAAPAAGAGASPGALLGEALEGWRFLRRRGGLLALLLLFAVVNFATGMVQVLVAPLVLTVADAATLGVVVAFHGAGFLAGGLLMSATGGPRRRVRAILALLLLQGALLIAAGLRPSVPLITAATSLFLCAAPVINGCSQVIWQSKVAPELMGRVFAIRRMVAFSTLPFAYLVAGPLAEHLCEPAMAPGGTLAATLGPLLGTGPGRGIGLLFTTLGAALLLLVSTTALRARRLRRLEEELPDLVG